MESNAPNLLEPNSNSEHFFKQDLQISWRLFKENWKTLISYGIFAILGSYFIIALFTIFILVLLIRIFEAMHWEVSIEFFSDIAAAMAIPQMIISFALYGCVYGLSYDIICSGDEFAEFKGSFMYFKKYWFQYVIISFFQGGFNLILSLIVTPDLTSTKPINIPFNQFILINALGYSIGMVWYFLFCITMPSVTAHGSLKRAFRENFVVVKEQKTKIIKVGLFYTFVVSVPLWIILMTGFYLAVEYSGPIGFAIEMIAIFTMIPVVLITNPLMALMLTRIYATSSVFNQLQQEKKEEESRIEINPQF
jgi:hypothetical protein